MLVNKVIQNDMHGQLDGTVPSTRYRAGEHRNPTIYGRNIGNRRVEFRPMR